MPKAITQLIDESLADWERKKLNCLPGKIPEAMQTGESRDDWTYWRAVTSTVTDQDILEMESLLGVRLSSQYREMLRHKHFMELQIGEVSIFSHPIGNWKAKIKEEVFRGYPKEFLIEKGYLPFADYSDWGLLCFKVTEPDANGEYPVYRWDHECPEKFEYFAPDLGTALEREAATPNMQNPEPKKRPLQQLELICIVIAAMPGILMFTGGGVRNQAQAIFRISIFVVGLLGFIAIKIYQRRKARGE